MSKSIAMIGTYSVNSADNSLTFKLLGETYTEALHKAYHALRERREAVQTHHSRLIPLT